MSGTTNIPCCYVLIRKDNELLFVFRENTGYSDNTYALPSGHVEIGESFSNGTAREALEEVNVKIDPTTLRHVHTMHRYQSDDNVRVDVFFEADEWSGEPKNNEPDKHSEIAWFSVNHLPDNVMDYQAYALEQMALGKTYSEWGW